MSSQATGGGGYYVPLPRCPVVGFFKPVLPRSEWLQTFTVHTTRCVCRAGESITYMQRRRHRMIERCFQLYSFIKGLIAFADLLNEPRRTVVCFRIRWLSAGSVPSSRVPWRHVPLDAWIARRKKTASLAWKVRRPETSAATSNEDISDSSPRHLGVCQSQPAADLGFFKGGKCWKNEDRALKGSSQKKIEFGALKWHILVHSGALLSTQKTCHSTV